MSNYTVEGFADTFSKLIKKHETATVFTDFLDYCISQFSIDIRFEARSRYSEEELKLFYELMEYWIILTNKEIKEHGWYDFFGEFYESYILAKFKAGDKGQFFTSPEVSNLLSQLVNESVDFFDATCGSGRNLLAAFVNNNNQGYCVGADLDEQACKMCLLNFQVHGVTGEVIHMDSLSGEVFNIWKVAYSHDLYDAFAIPTIREV